MIKGRFALNVAAEQAKELFHVVNVISAHGELAIGHLVKLSRRHNHAAKLKRESKSEKQFFAFDVSGNRTYPRHMQERSCEPDVAQPSWLWGQRASCPLFPLSVSR
jgi:hypothetical protein